MKKINLGFVLNFHPVSWNGGTYYIINLIEQIKKASKKYETIILVGTNIDDKSLKVFKKTKILKSRLFNNNFFTRWINKLLILIFKKNFLLENFLLKNNINLLSHFLATGSKSKIKSTFWIPDFQEISNLKYISLLKKFLRRLNYFYNLVNVEKIILSSETVKKDYNKLFPKFKDKSLVLKPFFNTPQKIKNKGILKKYNINKKFFLLPNQYWKHKNHFLILNALNKIKKKNKDIQIISTGYFKDHRYPEYTNTILEFIEKNSLSKNYKILGMIPYEDLMDLMQLSIAVINPSKSEGWSSTVEQAKSKGKLVLLSNLKVHKEQNPNRAFYFKVNDKNKISKILLKLHKNFSIDKENKVSKESRNFFYKQNKNFILDFLKSVNQIIKS